MPSQSTTVYLLRHAESRSSATVKQPDWPLTDLGKQQARDLVPILAKLGIDHVYTSPYLRAVETAKPFADFSSKPLRIHDDLREQHSLWVDSVEEFIEQMRKRWEDFNFAPPGGESNAECQLRIVNAVRNIVGGHPGSTLLVSSHGKAISLLLNSIHSSFNFERSMAMKNPDLFRITTEGASLVWDQSWQAQTTS